MIPRDVEQLRHRLQLITSAVGTLANHAEDLFALAYERSVTGNEPVNGHPWPPPGVEHHGDEHARELWHRLERAIPPIETSLRALEWAIGNLLSQGASPTEFHGDPPIARTEFRAALKQQQRRIERGEYTPTRTIDQPDWPNRGA